MRNKAKKTLFIFVMILILTSVTVFAQEEISLPDDFASEIIYTGSELMNVSGLTVSQDGKLYISDTGLPLHSGKQKISVIDLESMRISTLVSGMPLGFPGYMVIGDGRPLVGTDLIVADYNADTSSPCCNGRVFKIDRQSGQVSILSVGGPEVRLGDPGSVVLGPGGEFGTKLYVLDIQGASTNPPFLYTIDDDKSRSIFLRKPETWTINTLPVDIAFGPEAFGKNLYVTDAAWPSSPNYIYTTPTIWSVTPKAELTPFVSGAPLKHPVALEFGPGGVFGTDLYVLNTDENTSNISIFKISAQGHISVFASGIKFNNYMAGYHPDLAFALDGNSMYVGVGDRIIKISQSNYSPVAVAGDDQVIECGNSVTLDGSASNDPDGDSLIYRWSWQGSSAEGPISTVQFPMGATEVTLTVTDGKNTATDTVNIIVRDTVPPFTTIMGADDSWHNTDMQITFVASDSCSGVKDIHYSVNGVEAIISGDRASLALSADGIYDINYFSVDNTGNIESSKTVTLKIDKTSPALNLDINPAILWPPNHKMVNVAIYGGAFDSISGVTSVVFSVTDEYGKVQPTIPGFNTSILLEAWRDGSDSDGRHYTITATATDAAGNNSDVSAVVLVPHDKR